MSSELCLFFQPQPEASNITQWISWMLHVEALMWCWKPHVEARSLNLVQSLEPHVEASSIMFVWCLKPYIEASRIKPKWKDMALKYLLKMWIFATKKGNVQMKKGNVQIIRKHRIFEVIEEVVQAFKQIKNKVNVSNFINSTLCWAWLMLRPPVFCCSTGVFHM